MNRYLAKARLQEPEGCDIVRVAVLATSAAPYRRVNASMLELAAHAEHETQSRFGDAYGWITSIECVGGSVWRLSFALADGSEAERNAARKIAAEIVAMVEA